MFRNDLGSAELQVLERCADPTGFAYSRGRYFCGGKLEDYSPDFAGGLAWKGENDCLLPRAPPVQSLRLDVPTRMCCDRLTPLWKRVEELGSQLKK